MLNRILLATLFVFALTGCAGKSTKPETPVAYPSDADKWDPKTSSL